MPRLFFLLLVHHQGEDVTKVFSVRAAGPMIAIFLISDGVCVLERISTGRCSRMRWSAIWWTEDTPDALLKVREARGVVLAFSKTWPGPVKELDFP